MSNGNSPLGAACSTLRAAVADVLLSARADVNRAKPHNGVAPLFLACKGASAAPKAEASDNRNPSAIVDGDGSSGVGGAPEAGGNATGCERGAGGEQEDASALVALLLRHGADVKQVTTSGTSALWIAAHNGNEASARLLLLARASADDVDSLDGTSALWVASRRGHAPL
eukprot:6538225-Prymnesium_polylepis.1